MDAVEYYQNYIAHYGTKGQEWGKRHYQSYETAPTRSGMVGTELGEAAKQRSRKEEIAEEKAEKYRQKEIRYAEKKYDVRLNKIDRMIDKNRSEKHKGIYESRLKDLMGDRDRVSKEREDAINAVKNLTLKDIKAEKRQITSDTLLALGIQSGIAAALTVGTGTLYVANPVFTAATYGASKNIQRTRRLRKYQESQNTNS